MAVEVRAYKVGTSRSKPGAPVRWLNLLLAEPVDRVHTVSLFFYEELGTRELGFLNPETGFVVANLPVSDFDALYRIVNTEKPVFLHWRTDPGAAPLLSIDVSTSEEPPGEGPSDSSP
jgi:hypothetical protein